jgi:ferrous iron transport protein A
MADCLFSGDLMPVLLSDLQIGDIARVAGYSEQTAYASQLMCLGLIPGTQIEVQRVAPLGDPMEIRFRGFSLALRPREASCLQLERECPP